MSELTKTKLYVRNIVDSEIGESMLVTSVMAFQDFGKEVLGRDFEVMGSGNPLPDVRDYISGGVLDRDAYHSDLWRVYAANPRSPIFNLDIVDVPIMTEHYGKVAATSCQYLNPDTGENLSSHHQGVLLSTNPLFLNDGVEFAGAKAYVLTWHENGHLVYDRQDGCTDDSCVISHPKDRRGSLDKWASDILAGGELPICGGCETKFRDFKYKKF